MMTREEVGASKSLSLQMSGMTAVVRKGTGTAELAANPISKSLASDLEAS